MVSSDRDVQTGQGTSEDASPHDGLAAGETELAAAAERRPPSPPDGLRLAVLLAARLCHEISGPAGTLAGAVEIARTEPGSTAEALDIAAEAAAGLAARVRLLRAAWGGAAEALDIDGLLALCTGLPRHVRVDLDGLPAKQRFAVASAQVLLNVLLLAAESLPREGW